MKDLRERLISMATYAEKDSPLVLALIDVVCLQQRALQSFVDGHDTEKRWCSMCANEGEALNLRTAGEMGAWGTKWFHGLVSAEVATEALEQSRIRLEPWMNGVDDVDK